MAALRVVHHFIVNYNQTSIQLRGVEVPNSESKYAAANPLEGSINKVLDPSLVLVFTFRQTASQQDC